jgi:type IV pilus assembly protein PilQ
MAVGTTMLANPSYVNVSGPSVTMTLRNAPVKDVLMRLSSMGGYGFAYVDDVKAPSAGTRNVTIAFQNESFSRAFNAVLLSASLQGHRDGNMIMVGPNVLDKGFGSTLSKVYRLNQVSASAAADYLANLGATVTKTNTITTAVTEGASQNNAVAGAPNVATTNASTSTTVESYGSGVGPLRGLIGTTDTRLTTITLVGPPKVVAIAEQYLKQLDLRQRQVALSVKILDVSLQNDSSISNSFAFRYGNNFIVNDEGKLAGAWGNYLPPSASLGVDAVVGPVLNPGLKYPKDQFFDVLKATIESQSTKLLASPTLILTDNPELISGGGEVTTATSTSAGGASESVFSSSTIGRKRSNESFVTVGTQVITDYTVTTGTQGNGNACEPQFSTSGLTFGARVNKIDDNGFVTFNISPSVSAVTDQQSVEGCGPINILSIRRLDTGAVRVRDGQTLILTGVISDFNSQGVSKWPILGDMPLIGQFFRSTTGTRTKNELVILVTPHIINDTEGGTYGYGYQPSTGDARRLLGGNTPY